MMRYPLARRLGLGTVQFGAAYGISNTAGQVPESGARTIVDAATAAGIAVFDTAAAYGSAEDVLAACLAADHHARIVTKTLPLRHGGLDATLARLERSLQTLGRVDTVLVHHADDLRGTEGAELWARLARLKAAQRLEHIGFSAYADDRPAEFAERLSPDVVQIPISMLDQRLIDDGTLASLVARGIEVHARSIFLQGLIFLDPSTLPPKLARAAPQLAAVRARLHELGHTPLSASLAFIMSRPEVAIALVGVTQEGELADILAASERPGADLDWSFAAVNDPVLLNPALW